MNPNLSKTARNLLGIMAIAGLLITLAPSFFHWQGVITPERVNNLMLWGTVIWFIPAIILFGQKQKETEKES